MGNVGGGGGGGGRLCLSGPSSVRRYINVRGGIDRGGSGPDSGGGGGGETIQFSSRGAHLCRRLVYL